MKFLRASFALLLILLMATGALAQEPGRYERKSVSYVDVLLLGSPGARGMDGGEVSTLLDQIKNYVEMPRFDYNPLPEEMVSDFLSAARSEVASGTVLTDQAIADLMEEHLVPKIVEILEAQMQLRAENVMDPAKRQSFLATKAKEVGFTLEDIEKVMNAAYLYMPFATAYDEEKTDGGYKYTITGGILWYHVNMEGEQPRVELAVKNTSASFGCGDKDFAFNSMARNFARNLQVATQEIPDFKLQGQIRETVSGRVGFDMGRKEGVEIDKPFFVGEWVEETDGELAFVRKGWLRVKSVGDNREDRTQLSYGYTVKGNFGMYQTVIEHPRLPIDIALRMGQSQLEISEGFVYDPFLGNDAIVLKDFKGSMVDVDLTAQANIAGVFKTNQLWFTAGGKVSAPSGVETENWSTGEVVEPNLSAWDVHAGLMKKWYMRRLILSAEARFVYQGFDVTNTYIFGNSYEIGVSNQTMGGQLNLGFEYAATVDFHLGAFAGYRILPAIDYWELTIDGEGYGEATQYFTEEFPEINHSGLTFGIYLHYTPPSLPFDPFDYIIGRMQGGCD